ncbi:excisionase [Alcaligenes sp. Marseille-Q7550]
MSINKLGIAPARYVRLPLFEAITGYTEKAARRKIEDGVWLQDREYRRAPDGNILVDLEGYLKWVESANTRG